jgi:hypothetical protein
MREIMLIDPTETYCKAYLTFLKSMGITKIIGNPLDEHSNCIMEIDFSKITDKKLLDDIFNVIK